MANPYGLSPAQQLGMAGVRVRPHVRRMPTPGQGYAPGGVAYGGAGGYGPSMGSPPPRPQPMHTRGPTPTVVMQGGQPTLGGYASGDRQYQGIPGKGASDARQAAAIRYAQARLAQLQRVVSLLPQDLQEQLAASRRSVDPAAAWRGISGAFSNYSQQQGFNDPRYYLLNYLPEILRSQNAAGMNPRRGGV